MTAIPTKLTARRAELLCQAEDMFREHRIIDARLAEIDFAIAAYWEGRADEQLAACAAPEVLSAEAVVLGVEFGVPSDAPGAESASAGEYEATKPGLISADEIVLAAAIVHLAALSESPSTKRPDFDVLPSEIGDEYPDGIDAALVYKP